MSTDILAPDSAQGDMFLDAPSLSATDATCGGCHQTIEQDGAGVVVAFGTRLFHMDCFRCSKCNEKVTADTNLLLLSDGNPVCSNCSYQCFVCKQAIMDEAIMTGDESYHSSCFTCRHCSRKIEELVFAKTSQGIYCMSCHNERVAKSRRHAEAKRKQGKRDKEKLKEQQDNASLPSISGHSSANFSPAINGSPVVGNGSSSNQHGTSSSPLTIHPSSSPSPSQNFPGSAPPSSAAQSPMSGFQSDGTTSADETPRTRKETLELPQTYGSPIVNGTVPGGPRRKSADDGAPRVVSSLASSHSPSNSLSSPVMNGMGLGLGVPLAVPSSKADRRRSINPGMLNSADKSALNGTTSPPMSSSSSLSSINAAVTGDNSIISNSNTSGRLSPHPRSPLRESFISEGRSFDQFGKGGSSPSEHPLETSSHDLYSRATSPSSIRSIINTPTSPTMQSNLSMSPSPSIAPLNIHMKRTKSSEGTAGPPRTISLSNSLASSAMINARDNSQDSLTSSAGGGSSGRYDSGLEDGEGDVTLEPLRNGDSTYMKTISGTRWVGNDGDYFGVPRSSIDLLQPSRERASSSVSVDPPRLEAPRPISFMLADDPDFADLFKSTDLSASSLSPSQQAGLLASRSDTSNSNRYSTMTTDSLMTVKVASSDLEMEQNSAGQSLLPPTSPNIVPPSPSMSPSMNSIEEEPAEQKNNSSTTDEFTASESMTAIATLDSTDSFNDNDHHPQPSLSTPVLSNTSTSHHDTPDPFTALQVVIEASKVAGEKSAKVDVVVLESILTELFSSREKFSVLKGKYDGIKRASAQYIEGLTVASEEYEKEMNSRRDAEAEVKRLRVQIHGQTARLSMVDAESRRQDSLQRRSRELAQSLYVLEKDISKLRVERDVTLAEVEELSNSAKSGSLDVKATESTDASISRSLSLRLDVVKEHYREELEPLTAEREKLTREINELKETCDTFMEQSTALSARNEELAELQASLLRQVEAAQDAVARSQQQQKFNGIFGGGGPRALNQKHPNGSPSLSSIPSTTTLREESNEEVAKYIKVVKQPALSTLEHMEPAPPVRKFKWYKSSKGPVSDSTSSYSQNASGAISSPSTSTQQPRKDSATSLTAPSASAKSGRSSHELNGNSREHVFHPYSIPTLRFTRCEHCGDKMWGLQELKCGVCGVNCHARCSTLLHTPCTRLATVSDEVVVDVSPLPPSMFGRSLTEQAESDGHSVPVIVTKSIAAVEAQAMEYEGIYRKTGGSSQSKHITQLFERGDYSAFDLENQDVFNDISSVTSVLKNYFRALPDPLLTFALHEKFVAGATIRDLELRKTTLTGLLTQLPPCHYETLKTLMLHLNRVMLNHSENLMTARNLGVVFGPTLMRSADRSREFGDMAGKAQCIEFLVEHAKDAFASPLPTPPSEENGDDLEQASS